MATVALGADDEQHSEKVKGNLRSKCYRIKSGRKCIRIYNITFLYHIMNIEKIAVNKVKHF